MSRFDNILGIDAALNGCGVAVLAGDKRVQRSQVMERGQSERLLPLIEEAMAEAGLDYAQLQAVVTTLGPGAFTGLRIGLSTAKTFGLSLDIPVYGVSTLQALAWEFAAENKAGLPFWVVLETKRQDFYAQSFTAAGSALTPPAALEEQILRDCIEAGGAMIGDGTLRLGAVAGTRVHPGCMLPDVGKLVARFQAGDDADRFTTDLAPIYLRGADVSQPKAPQRVIAAK